MNIKISDIEAWNRPRERLKNIGAENLSDDEILAIILKTGTKNVSVKSFASYVLSVIGGLKGFKDVNYEKLTEIKGIGDAKATLLLAISEFSKRINKENNVINNLKINTPSVIFDYYKDILGNKKQEHFYCIYLDIKKRVISSKLLFIGTIDQSLVHPREIFKEAFLVSAVSIICVHNHPSNNVIPSKADISFTEKLVKNGLMLGINIVDHIIIGETKYYSFYENGNI